MVSKPAMQLPRCTACKTRQATYDNGQCWWCTQPQLPKAERASLSGAVEHWGTGVRQRPL